MDDAEETARVIVGPLAEKAGVHISFDAHTALVPQLADLIRAYGDRRSAEAASPAAGWRPTHLHYKGGYYRFICTAAREGDCDPMVVYEGENGERWVRPESEWLSSVGDAGAARFNPLDSGAVEAWQRLRSPSEEARAG